ncbi:MAG: hypothetical protein AAB268_10505 [Elusimicrobiota bacterium]
MRPIAKAIGAEAGQIHLLGDRKHEGLERDRHLLAEDLDDFVERFDRRLPDRLLRFEN